MVLRRESIIRIVNRFDISNSLISSTTDFVWITNTANYRVIILSVLRLNKMDELSQPALTKQQSTEQSRDVAAMLPTDKYLKHVNGKNKRQRDQTTCCYVHVVCGGAVT